MAFTKTLSSIENISISSLTTSCLVILFTAFLAQKFCSWHRLSHIPGPFWASISKYWLVKQSLTGRMHIAMKEACDKHGSLARIGPNDLVTNDSALLRRMMAVRSLYTRGDWYDAMRFDPERDNLLSMRDDELHRKLRNKMAAGYSGKENESTEVTIDRQISKLVSLIEQKYISTSSSYRPMDFGQKGQFFTLDVISDLAFGRPFGYLNADDDVYDYIKITDDYFPAMIVMASIPALARLTQTRMFRGLLPKGTDKLGFGAFIGVAQKLSAERFLPEAKPQKDMISSFISHGLTQMEVSSETLLAILAGSDTSAATIRAVLLNLMSAPLIYSRFQAEIDTATSSGKISSPIIDSEARKLPYLQAVIKEGLRIMPPATGLFPKTVPKGGEMINGYFVPEGTNIGTTMLGVQYDREVFGEDAEIFRPERWLEAEGEKLKAMNETVDLVFHYGKWQCLGKPVALMELNKVFVELLRRFDFAIVNVNNPAKIFNAGLWMISDFWVRVTQR